MSLIMVVSVLVVAVLVAVLAICLFMLGTLLGRIADNLEDCSYNVRRIGLHAKVIRPGITRLNKSAADLAGALPLVAEGAGRLVAAKSAPPPEPHQHVGYMDVETPEKAPTTTRHDPPELTPVGVGYLD